MALNSLEFLLFAAAAAAVYYLIPGKVQWIWLLVCSYIYYLSQGPHLPLAGGQGPCPKSLHPP